MPPPRRLRLIDAGQVIQPPKQARSRARFDNLLQAAAELIAEEGVDGLAFSAIARRAATAQGSLYQYFPSKDALLATLHARLAGKLAAAIAEGDPSGTGVAAGPADADTVIGQLVARVAAFYAAHPAYLAIRQALPRHPVIDDTEGRLDQEVAQALAAMLRAGGLVIPADRLRLVTEVLIEAGDALLAWAGTDPVKLEEVETLLRAYLRARLP